LEDLVAAERAAILEVIESARADYANLYFVIIACELLQARSERGKRHDGLLAPALGVGNVRLAIHA
jgi:hypothetical protein